MKNPFDHSTTVLGLSFLAIIMAGGWSMHQGSVLEEAAAQYNAMFQTSEQLLLVKERWGNTPEIQRKISFLKGHPALIRQEQRPKSLRLEYENLSGNEFDRIASTLLNAPFIITKLELTRRANAGTIIVEIER